MPRPLITLVSAVSIWTGPLLAQSFDPLTTTFAQRRDPIVFAVADFDGDGDADVVMQAAIGGVTRWELHRNDGEGQLVPELIAVPLVGVSAHAIAVGDFDGNGTPDLAVANASVGLSTGQILSNNGQGVFQSVVMPNAFRFAVQILPVDIDSDSDLDLVFANASPGFGPVGPSQLLQNDGTGSFTDVTASMMPNPVSHRTSVAAIDVQSDGLVDLVLDGWPLHVMLRQPAGGFVHAPGFFTTGMSGIRATDVDGDGDLDLAGHRVHLLVIQRNDGGGVFTTINHPVPDIGGLRPADIDGDGDQDFLTNTLTGTDARLWRTDPGLLVTEVTSTQLPVVVGSATVGAFFDGDGDGDRDLWLPAGARLLFNNGTGRFASAGERAVLTFDRAVTASDVDGDGHVDLVGLDTMTSSSTTTLDLAWWRNDGTDRFAHAGVLAAVPVCNASKVVAFDMDGDGDDEIWSLQCLTDRVWRNHGGGVLTEVTATTFPLDTRTDVAVLPRDYDGDGDIDVFVARDYLFDSIYINQGNGTFLDEGLTRLTDNELTRAAAALDYDGDGDTDLVLGNDPTPLRLFANNGTANFTEVSTALPTLIGTVSHVLAVDGDGDGDDDLVLVRAGSTVLLRNNGGTFVVAPSQQLPSVTNGFWPQAVDFDRDGDLDLLLGSTWLVNDGSGAFLPSSVQADMPPAAHHRPSVFADIDRDGDADILYGALRYNLHRQLASALPPRLGFHGEVRMHARSAQPGWTPLVLLYFSDVLAPPVSLGAFGRLHLNAANLALLSSHLVPPQPGYAIARYLVPNATGLLGVTIPLQALIIEGPTAHATNATLLEVRQ